MMIMQPSKIFLTVLPPVIPPPTQLVIEGYFLILKHTHTDAHTCWYLWLSSLANALSSMVMLRHYSFLKSCPPSPRWTSLFCGWLQQFLHQLFCMYMCTHARTHTQNSSAKQKSIHAISLLKTLEWLPKILKKKKKKNPSSYHGLQGPARPDPHLTHHLMYLPDRFHFWSTYTQHPFHSSLQGLCTIFPHMKVLVAQLYLESIDSSPLRLLHPWEFSSKNTSPIYTPENKLY